MDVGITALQVQVATLTARLEQLEKDKEGPLTVKGPFIVKNAQGTEIFRVDAAGSGGEMTIIGGNSRLELEADSAAALRLSDSASSATLTTEGGSHINLKSGNRQFFAGPSDGNMMRCLEGRTNIRLSGCNTRKAACRRRYRCEIGVDRGNWRCLRISYSERR